MPWMNKRKINDREVGGATPWLISKAFIKRTTHFESQADDDTNLIVCATTEPQNIENQTRRPFIPIELHYVPPEVPNPSPAQAALLNAKDRTGTTPLHAAASAGKTNVISFLTNKGAKVDALDDCGMSPLHLAAAAAEYDAVRELLIRGADPDLRDAMYNMTPAEMAIAKNCSEKARQVADLLNRAVVIGSPNCRR